MKTVSDGIRCTFQRCRGYVDIEGCLPATGRQNKCGVGIAIFEQNALVSLARWRWRLLHYFKQVVNLSATCFHVELEQFSACFRVARVCQRQLGFLVHHNYNLLIPVPQRSLHWLPVESSAIADKPRDICASIVLFQSCTTGWHWGSILLQERPYYTPYISLWRQRAIANLADIFTEDFILNCIIIIPWVLIAMFVLMFFPIKRKLLWSKALDLS